MNPTRPKFKLGGAIMVCAALLGFAGMASAQERPAADERDKSSSTAEPSGLNEAESSLGRRYRQFERTLLQMAEYLRKTEPERADLLIRAIGKSKEDRVSLQMDQILDLLKSEQLGDAIGRQEHLVTNLKGLLELLQSEDRRHQLEEEKKWLESLHKEIGKLTVREKELRRATEQGKNIGPLSGRQAEIGRDAKSLEQKIDKQDAARNAANRRNPSEKSSKSSDGRDGKKGSDSQKSDKQNPDDGSKPKEQNSGEQNSKEQNPKENGKNPNDKRQAKGKPNDQAPKNKSGEKKESKKSQGGAKNPSKQPNSDQQNDGSPEGAPSEQSENDSSPQQMRKTPGRKEIEEARRAMQQAEEELKRLQGDKALERQDEAIRKLAEAKERLEKILRQLREEEQEIMLTSLEARFAKMLLMQIQLHVDTVTLGKTAKNAWTARHFGKARELSVQQDSIGDEAAKALTLLKEEGSSVAFPKGVEQVRDDMLTIAVRLGKNDVGELTQSIEKDVIESLEELVASLQSEIENRKKPDAQRQRRQRPGGDQADKQLVEKIAELKMLRSLQLRVNRRTKEIGRLIHGEQADTDDLAGRLQTLARRQAEIQEATYILASGRNQ